MLMLVTFEERAVGGGERVQCMGGGRIAEGGGEGGGDLQELRLGNGVHDREGGVAHQGVAGKGGAVVPWLHSDRHMLPNQ